MSKIRFNDFFNFNIDPLHFRTAWEWEKTSPGQKHLFHIVTPSPWPIVASIAALFLTTGSVSYLHFFKYGGSLFMLGLLLLIGVMFAWWRDVIREATFLGYHNYKVQLGLRLGFILFIVSEVMFFFSWFWAYFHSSLAPSIELGLLWPPVGFTSEICIHPFTVPLLNTVVLVFSGVTITLSHKAIRCGYYEYAFNSLILTIFLGLEFTMLQLYEYIKAPFDISDSVYGSCFFMITGFHGFHVICGTIFLVVCAFRLYYGHFTADRHLGFEFAIWYWHFVDVIWIIVFLFLYIWGFPIWG